jgi:hypothetical protein
MWRPGKKIFTFFLLYYFLNIYMQIWPYVVLAWSSAAPRPSSWQRHCQHDSTETSRHDQVASTTSSSAWLSRDITPRPSCLGSIIASMTRQRHHATVQLPRQRHRQHDSAPTSRHGQVASVAPSPAWLDIDIASIAPLPAWLDINVAPWSSCLGYAIVIMTQGLGIYFPD